MLHFGYKYGGDFRKCLIESVNTGGENVARGATLGALLGTAYGASRIPQDFKRGLNRNLQVRKDIEAFVAALMRPALAMEPKENCGDVVDEWPTKCEAVTAGAEAVVDVGIKQAPRGDAVPADISADSDATAAIVEPCAIPLDRDVEPASVAENRPDETAVGSDKSLKVIWPRFVSL